MVPSASRHSSASTDGYWLIIGSCIGVQCAPTTLPHLAGVCCFNFVPFGALLIFLWGSPNLPQHVWDPQLPIWSWNAPPLWRLQMKVLSVFLTQLKHMLFLKFPFHCSGFSSATSPSAHFSQEYPSHISYLLHSCSTPGWPSPASLLYGLGAVLLQHLHEWPGGSFSAIPSRVVWEQFFLVR